MKIIENGKAFVQKKDLVCFTRGVGGITFPSSIFEKMFGVDIVQPFCVDRKSQYEFVEFDRPEEVEFFKSSSWILDFRELNGMTYDEVFDVRVKLFDEQLEYLVSITDTPLSYRNSERRAKIWEYDYKLDTLADMLKYKQGLLSFAVPKIEEEKKEEEEPPEEKEKLFRRVFGVFRRKRKNSVGE